MYASIEVKSECFEAERKEFMKEFRKERIVIKVEIWNRNRNRN